ncbi:hypothetical protein MMON_24650 [Mycolicibacterium monacense]|uniref:Uncharacterized protein n=1 Tax=Mycolicibacterium monacense TaxID=85693 RepID=A0AAD1MZ06_MYCMB|nr:hypothetical protein MMON_24650 [Mycolicibacterium monacense]
MSAAAAPGNSPTNQIVNNTAATPDPAITTASRGLARMLGNPAPTLLDVVRRIPPTVAHVSRG